MNVGGGSAHSSAATPPMLDKNATEFITFLVNNLTRENLHNQIITITELIVRYGDDLRRYITQQFSRNRVLHEPNNLIMYADMIEALRDPILERMIVFDCVQIIREQLNSSGGGGDNSARVKERLRNIATFVGLLTMARDEPLTADYLDVKQELSLAVGSDNSARISLLVTIICHLLKHCEQSTIFKKECTWTKRIIDILMDIYQNERTELSVCLEIERYFDTINHKYKDEESPSSSSSVSSASSTVYAHQHQQPPPLPLYPHAQYYQKTPPMNIQMQKQLMQIPDVDPIIRLLVNQLDFNYAQLFILLPRCRDVVAEKFTRILAEVERKFVERNSEAIDAYCECVVMRDVAFCPDTSQIRCCFRYMLRSLLLSMFQPRYAVAQVRQEFTCYMKLLLERIIEVLIAQPTPNVSPFVAQLRLMTPEAHKQEIEQTATIFMQRNQQIVTECMLVLLNQRAINIAESKLQTLLNAPNRIQLAMQHFIGGPRSQIELNFKLPPLLRRATAPLNREQIVVYTQHDSLANTLHSYLEQYGINYDEKDF